ncbi:unnamed protein product [Lactuca saligna]|uniref:T-complex protein 1 subunit theta n=1 Tax=Lactuca saligna TaxID=75948 RepID=A0AA35YYL9_LACSI|nr:unnamed protein product [Lactuca saligna]
MHSLSLLVLLIKRSNNKRVANETEVKIPFDLIVSCVATYHMIQSCTERQYPPGDVVQILDSTFRNLHPLSSQNLGIFREIEMCMGRVKTQILALLKLGAVNPDDLGYVDSISVEEIGDARVTVVRNEQGGNSVTMVLLRGSTYSILDDTEMAVDDGVNTYKALCKDNRIVLGAVATEIELARKLKEFSFSETGLDHYAIGKFAESFEMIPKTLAENVGLNAMEITSTLYADHANGNVKVGIDLEEEAWLMKANSSGVRRGKESLS